MGAKKPSAKRTQRETNASVLHNSVIRRLGPRTVAQGDIAFPCVPSMIDVYMTKLATLFEILGQPFSTDDLAKLRSIIERTLADGFRTLPTGKLIVGFLRRPDVPGISYNVRFKQETMEDLYENWVAEGKPPPFGAFADAKVMSLAAELGDPKEVPVLDIGAGTGRNALALSRIGHPVDAIEPTAVLVRVMNRAIEAEALPIKVIERDVLLPDVTFERGRYRLVVLAEVISHFRGPHEVRKLFEKLKDALAPRGILLVSTFLTTEGYKPDVLAREASEIAWSYLFTRDELRFIVDELPFDRLSDESVCDYEKEHLPEGAWPPTPWFPGWALGQNIFELPAGKVPAELRWLAFRRRD